MFVSASPCQSRNSEAAVAVSEYLSVAMNDITNDGRVPSNCRELDGCSAAPPLRRLVIAEPRTPAAWPTPARSPASAEEMTTLPPSPIAVVSSRVRRHHQWSSGIRLTDTRPPCLPTVVAAAVAAPAPARLSSAAGNQIRPSPTDWISDLSYWFRGGYIHSFIQFRCFCRCRVIIALRQLISSRHYFTIVFLDVRNFIRQYRVDSTLKTTTEWRSLLVRWYHARLDVYCQTLCNN